jgi:hypothetical protein
VDYEVVAMNDLARSARLDVPPAPQHASANVLERIRALAYWDASDDIMALRTRLAVIGGSAADALNERQKRNHDEELCEAVRTILGGFDEGVFVRNISGDNDPSWAIKFMPFVRAIGIAQNILSEPARAVPAVAGKVDEGTPARFALNAIGDPSR